PSDQSRAPRRQARPRRGRGKVGTGLRGVGRIARPELHPGLPRPSLDDSALPARTDSRRPGADDTSERALPPLPPPEPGRAVPPRAGPAPHDVALAWHVPAVTSAPPDATRDGSGPAVAGGLGERWRRRRVLRDRPPRPAGHPARWARGLPWR